MRNKVLKSNYIGTPEKWVDFIVAWQLAIGIDLEMDKPTLGKTLRGGMNIDIELPKSCLDFYVAMKALGWPDILKIDDSARLKIVKPERLDSLFYYDPITRKLAADCDDEKVPQFIAREDYCIYKRDFYHEFSPRVFALTYPIASRRDSIYENWLTINPLVRFKDGEWEALYIDMRGHFFAKFQSFADAVCWFYLTDIGIYSDQDELPWLDHTFDTTGLSRLLFSE